MARPEVTSSDGQTIINALATNETDSYSLSGLSEICLELEGTGFTGSVVFTIKPTAADIATPIVFKNLTNGTLVNTVTDFSSRVRLQLIIPIVAKLLIIAITRSAGSITIKKWTR